MGSFNEAEETDGRVLRPRDPFECDEPSGSSVEAEEVLADDECLLSALKGDSVREVTGPSSQIESSLKWGSILVCIVSHQNHRDCKRKSG